MPNDLIRPVSDEYLAMTVETLVSELEVIYRRPANDMMRDAAVVQVAYVLKGVRTPDSPYDPIDGFLNASVCVKELTRSIANWLRYDYAGPAEDGEFLARTRQLLQQANA